MVAKYHSVVRTAKSVKNVGLFLRESPVRSDKYRHTSFRYLRKSISYAYTTNHSYLWQFPHGIISAIFRLQV